MADPDYYTLQGVRVGVPRQPGVYVHDGRKELKH